MNINGDDVDIRPLSGQQAALLVPQLWAALSPQRRRYVVWDAANLHGPSALAKIVGLGNESIAAWVNGAILGIAWVIPLCTGSRCGLIHMACTGPRYQAEAIGNAWLSQILPRYYDSLLAFLPLNFRHIRAMIEAMGFRIISRIPGGACLTMRGNRIVTSVLYQKDL